MRETGKDRRDKKTCDRHTEKQTEKSITAQTTPTRANKLTTRRRQARPKRCLGFSFSFDQRQSSPVAPSAAFCNLSWILADEESKEAHSLDHEPLAILLRQSGAIRMGDGRDCVFYALIPKTSASPHPPRADTARAPVRDVSIMARDKGRLSPRVGLG